MSNYAEARKQWKIPSQYNNKYAQFTTPQYHSYHSMPKSIWRQFSPPCTGQSLRIPSWSWTAGAGSTRSETWPQQSWAQTASSGTEEGWPHSRWADGGPPPQTASAAINKMNEDLTATEKQTRCPMTNRNHLQHLEEDNRRTCPDSKHVILPNFLSHSELMQLQLCISKMSKVDNE